MPLIDILYLKKILIHAPRLNCISNMKNYYNLFRKLLISALFLLGTIGAISQVKIGTAPTRINKSSILELESDRQGLLLTRLTDTLGINTLTPPDGMLIYLSSTTAASRGLYIRKSGIWQKIRTDSASIDKWSKTGDALTGTEKLGSLNAQTLRMITNNIERMSVDGSTGNITINKSLTVTDTTSSRRLIVSDSVRFKSLNRSSSLTEILLVDTTTGSVQRRAIATDAFRNWVVGNMSLTANAKGLSRVTGTNGTDTLVLHAATQTTGGGVSTTTQTFGGNKTFNDSLTVNRGSTLNGGTMANGGLTVPGATGTTAAVSSLTLGVTSATTPELVTDKYLSVNSTGQVTLNEANIITNRQLKVKV